MHDRFRNSLNAYYERKHPYTITIIGENEKLKQDVINSFNLYDIYDITEAQDTNTSSIVIAIGTYPKHTLQSLADKARINSQSFYHISDHLELEDLISSPTRV